MISRALEAEILRLYHTEHWPIGTIATQLRVHHTTVRRVLAATGMPTAQKTVRPSMVEPYLAFIVETLTKFPTLRASRLYQMVRERGYPGATDHFRTIVARLRPRPAGEAYLRLRTLPGEQAQVDWAHFGKLGPCRAPADGVCDGAELLTLPVSALLSERRHEQLRACSRRGLRLF